MFDRSRRLRSRSAGQAARGLLRADAAADDRPGGAAADAPLLQHAAGRHPPGGALSPLAAGRAGGGEAVCPGGDGARAGTTGGERWKQ